MYFLNSTMYEVPVFSESTNHASRVLRCRKVGKLFKTGLVLDDIYMVNCITMSVKNLNCIYLKKEHYIQRSVC